ncbi:hypothetical protein ACIOVF_22925, partial [Pseudomonas sp. NPDC087612]|uniref:hypothetical protein n=1 Tax=Pseudomonas sp. NPDC087612 TaxID=3364441 RepID=UPI0037FE172D
SDLSVSDRLATFKIGGGRSQPETHGYFRPSLTKLSFFDASESAITLSSFSEVPIVNLGTHENFETARSVR